MSGHVTKKKKKEEQASQQIWQKETEDWQVED